MADIRKRLKDRLPSKRRIVQLYAALLYNANLKGFVTGKLYTGPLKNLCVPGLNCYSCPGAIGACPLGALQNALASSGKRIPYYILGILLLFGVIAGRTICGWLCPTGLAQDLLYKLPTSKLRKSRVTRILSFLKYGILILLVTLIPLFSGFTGPAVPAFCKYLCPAGTLEGAGGLLLSEANDGLYASLGRLFVNKYVLLIVLVTAAVFIYRAFCRFLCPLGAILGLLNRFSFLGIRTDRERCNSCGACVSACPMDIRFAGDHECISCGKCIDVCGRKAIVFRAGKWLPHGNEAGKSSSDEREIVQKPRAGKRPCLFLKIAAVLLMLFSLWYFNFSPAARTSELSAVPETGSQVGMLAPEIAVDLTEGGKWRLSEHRGEVIVLNFWATW